MKLLRRNRVPVSALPVLADAERAARARGAHGIGTEDLLVALAWDENGIAGRALRSLDLDEVDLRARDGTGAIDAEALASIGIDLDAVVRSVEESFGPGALDRTRTANALPLTANARRALDRAACGDTGDLLVALVDEFDVAALLARHGIAAADVVEAVADARLH